MQAKKRNRWLQMSATIIIFYISVREDKRVKPPAVFTTGDITEHSMQDFL